jgi:hypothetical protein
MVMSGVHPVGAELTVFSVVSAMVVQGCGIIVQGDGLLSLSTRMPGRNTH